MSNQLRTRRDSTEARISAPVFTSESDDLREVLDYLPIAQSSAEAQAITGLTKSAISEVLAVKRPRGTHRRRHIAIVAAVIRELAAVRSVSTGSAERGKSAIGWLHTGVVETSRGRATPLEVLAASDLAAEALEDLRR